MIFDNTVRLPYRKFHTRLWDSLNQEGKQIKYIIRSDRTRYVRVNAGIIWNQNFKKSIITKTYDSQITKIRKQQLKLKK